MTRTVLVAGVGRTIGSATARRFAADGWHVALLARSGDVTDPEAVERAVGRASEELGPVACVVCNATADGGHPPETADAETFRRMFEVRAVGSFHLVRAVTADLGATGGTALFSGTTYATDPAPEQVEWGVGAPAARGLARTLDAAHDGFDTCYVRIGSAVRPPESEFPGALAASEVAERYRELVASEDPPTDVLLE
jgi:NAD(P)-dependent dehydrogenase (short-subunit alcohol dehydrogenase family)